MKQTRLFACVSAVAMLIATSAFVNAETFKVTSPNKAVEITVNQNESAPTYSVSFKGKTVLNESKTGLKLRDIDSEKDWKFINKTDESANSTWTHNVGKKSTYVDNYNQITLTYAQGDLQVSYMFRAYDDGLAFRYVLNQNGESKQYVVEADNTTYEFPSDFEVWTSKQRKVNSSQEELFFKNKLSELKDSDIIICPVVVEASDFCAAITEADLFNWSGAKFASAENGKTALKTNLTPRHDNNGCVVCNTPAQSTWKVILLGEKPVDLINNSGIILNVSTPCQIGDASWVEPGVSGWDWWSGSNKVMNTGTTLDKIANAADMGWEFMTIDDPWYYSSKFKRIKGKDPDTTRSVDYLDLDRILAYAKERGVRIFFWLHYTDLKQCGVEKTFKKYAEWGVVAGVKIDFMDSEEQETVEWITETAALAAKYHLMVNYHGMFKPTGMERTYPNQLTREGILGNENNKGSRNVTSTHTATLPFTRYLCGPGDYTPGGTLNDQPEKFVKQSPTHVMGTRAHEMALCIIYDSPIMTMCDAPENYRGVAGVEILKNLPAAWDNTVAVDGKISEFLVQTRQKGDMFYAGAITDTNARKCELKLDFLKAGKTYSALIVKDVPESDQDARKVKVETIDVTSNDTLTIDMVRNGGWCARFTEK